MNDLCKKWIQSRIEKLYQREEEDLNNTRSVKISQNQRFEKIRSPSSTKIRNILSTHYLSTLETDRIKMDSILNEAPQLSSFLLDLEAWFTKIGGGWPSSARVHRIFRWMVEERDIIPREIHRYSLWPHMLFSPRVCIQRLQREGEGRRMEEKNTRRERERRIETRRDGAGCASPKFFIL